MIGISTLADNPVHLAATASMARHDEILPAEDEADADEIEEETFADGVRRVRGADGQVVYIHPPLASPVTLPTPTPPTEAELRWSLRRALAGLDGAAGRARNARRALAEAETMLSAVESALANHRAAEHGMAEAAGEALARRIADGTSDALPAHTAAPVDLTAITLGQQRAAIKAAIVHLQDDRDRATAAHEMADGAVVTARAAIVAHEVNHMVRRLLDLERQAAAIRSRLVVRSAALVPWPPANARLDASGPQYLASIAFWRDLDAGLRKSPEFSAQSLLGEQGV
jgi:hypothetical protein